MKAPDLEQIRTFPLFCTMQEAHFCTLLRGAYIQNFPAQMELISEGDPSDFLHIVVTGSVELFASWERRETMITIAKPFSTLLLAATIKDAPYLMSARTLEKSRIVLLPSADVRDVFAADNAFSRALVDEMSKSYRTLVKNTKNLKLRTAVERLANYLLYQHRDLNQALDFTLNIEKRKLASLLGMTPENLSRAIKTLQPYGVKIEGPRVWITDAQALGKFARATPLIDEESY